MSIPFLHRLESMNHTEILLEAYFSVFLLADDARHQTTEPFTSGKDRWSGRAFDQSRTSQLSDLVDDRHSRWGWIGWELRKPGSTTNRWGWKLHKIIQDDTTQILYHVYEIIVIIELNVEIDWRLGLHGVAGLRSTRAGSGRREGPWDPWSYEDHKLRQESLSLTIYPYILTYPLTRSAEVVFWRIWQMTWLQLQESSRRMWMEPLTYTEKAQGHSWRVTSNVRFEG